MDVSMSDDIYGRLVDRLVDGDMAAGSHEIRWQPEKGLQGIYMIRLQTGGTHRTIRIIQQ